MPDGKVSTVFRLNNQELWSPEHPQLYDLTIEVLAGGKVLDRVSSYFGQRKISAQEGHVILNNVTLLSENGSRSGVLAGKPADPSQ